MNILGWILLIISDQFLSLGILFPFACGEDGDTAIAMLNRKTSEWYTLKPENITRISHFLKKKIYVCLQLDNAQI